MGCSQGKKSTQKMIEHPHRINQHHHNYDGMAMGTPAGHNTNVADGYVVEPSAASGN